MRLLSRHLLRSSPFSSSASVRSDNIKVDWAKVLSKTSPSVRKAIMDTRIRHEELLRQVNETRAAIPSISFADYLGKLPDNQRLVDELEAQFKEFVPKQVDTTGPINAWEMERSAKLAEAQELLVSLEHDIEKSKDDLDKLENAKPVEEITVEDVYEMRPDLREEFRKTIEDDRWSTGDAQEELKAIEKEANASKH